MDFLKLAQDRYSCRTLTDAPVEQEKIDAIVASAIAAPTACNNQPWKVWVFRSAEALEKARATTPCAFGGSVMFAVGGKPEEAWVRHFDRKNFVDVDASIVATHMLLAIQDQGLGTTWIGHFDEAALKAAFPEMKDYEMIALFPVGYAAADAVPAKGHFNTKAKDELITVL